MKRLRLDGRRCSKARAVSRFRQSAASSGSQSHCFKVATLLQFQLPPKHDTSTSSIIPFFSFHHHFLLSLPLHQPFFPFVLSNLFFVVRPPNSDFLIPTILQSLFIFTTLPPPSHTNSPGIYHREYTPPTAYKSPVPSGSFRTRCSPRLRHAGLETLAMGRTPGVTPPSLDLPPTDGRYQTRRSSRGQIALPNAGCWSRVGTSSGLRRPGPPRTCRSSISDIQLCYAPTSG